MWRAWKGWQPLETLCGTSCPLTPSVSTGALCASGCWSTPWLSGMTSYSNSSFSACRLVLPSLHNKKHSFQHLNLSILWLGMNLHPLEIVWHVQSHSTDRPACWCTTHSTYCKKFIWFLSPILQGHHQRRNWSHLVELCPAPHISCEGSWGPDHRYLFRHPPWLQSRSPVRGRCGLLPVVGVSRGPAEWCGVGQRVPEGAAAPEE